MSIWDDIKKELEKSAKEAIDDFKNEAGEDVDDLQDRLSDALSDAAEALREGKSIDDVIKDMDAEATFLLSASYSTISKHQIKLAKSISSILERILWTIVCKAILHP